MDPATIVNLVSAILSFIAIVVSFFLVFLTSWLNGRSNYLNNLFDRDQIKQFYNGLDRVYHTYFFGPKARSKTAYIEFSEFLRDAIQSFYFVRFISEKKYDSLVGALTAIDNAIAVESLTPIDRVQKEVDKSIVVLTKLIEKTFIGMPIFR